MKKTAIFLLCSLLFTSCGHSYYDSNLQNITLFRQAGDNQIILSSGGGTDNSSTLFDVQAAYALTNHLELSGSYLSNEQSNTEKPETDYAKGKLYEVGVGYYEPLGRVGSFDVMVGYGLGHQFHHYDTYTTDWDFEGTGEDILETGYARFRFNRCFLQSSVGLTTRIVDLALSGRITNVNYFDVHSQIDGQGDEYNVVSNLEGLGTLWFEPALTLRLGYDPIKLQLQMAMITPITQDNPPASSLNVNLGLVFRIPLSKKTKQP